MNQVRDYSVSEVLKYGTRVTIRAIRPEDRTPFLEAFRLMLTFFIHDLKNTASTLNLTLQNLPRHFDNPEFR